ncbi:MAG: ATP-binding protein [Elusimicrobia bacterium]|nr:ATP-binding protein [Elusimicrobiota bacterium]
MYIKRLIEKTIEQVRTTFPAVVITGPRQSGKSTLLKHIIQDPDRIVTLENPDVRLLIMEDPLFFLQSRKKPLVLDEIQYLPIITTYLKIFIDKERIPGQWFITGSQQFSVMKNVSESLAGRAAILVLPPFHLQERKDVKNLGDFMFSSSYPELCVKKNINRTIWFSSYLQTYLERDLRALINVNDLKDFEQFLRLLAARAGQILNLSGISAEMGISVPTVKRWVSALEASYIVYLLPPLYNNYGKRIIKSPKLYFYDMGLLNYLLRMPDAQTLLNSPLAGALFENAVVSEILKKKLAEGIQPELYFWRSQSGVEIDLITRENGRFIPYEIKLSSIIRPQFFKNLAYWLALEKDGGPGRLITNCSQDLPMPHGIKNIHWENLGLGG